MGEQTTRIISGKNPTHIGIVRHHSKHHSGQLSHPGRSPRTFSPYLPGERFGPFHIHIIDSHNTTPDIFQPTSHVGAHAPDTHKTYMFH